MLFRSKTLVFLALLVAIQLVLSRVLVIDLGVYRITLGTVATVLAGLWMGPVAGGVEGAVADIIGCFMKGYGVNPLITLSAVAWGVIPGLAGKLMAEKNRKVKTVVTPVPAAGRCTGWRCSCRCCPHLDNRYLRFRFYPERNNHIPICSHCPADTSFP